MLDPNIQGSEPGQIEPGTNEPGAGQSGQQGQDANVPFVEHFTIQQAPVEQFTIGT